MQYRGAEAYPKHRVEVKVISTQEFFSYLLNKGYLHEAK